MNVLVLCCPLVGFYLPVEVSYIGVLIEVRVIGCLLRRKVFKSFTCGSKLRLFLLNGLELYLAAASGRLLRTAIRRICPLSLRSLRALARLSLRRTLTLLRLSLLRCLSVEFIGI